MRNNLFLVTPAVEKWTITDVFIFSSLFNYLISLLADCLEGLPVVSSWEDFVQVYNPDVSNVLIGNIDFQVKDSLSSWISNLAFDSLEIGDFALFSSFWERSD